MMVVLVLNISQVQTSQITLKIDFFDPNFTFGVPKSHKNPGVGAWVVSQIWENFPKKRFYFFGASLIRLIEFS